MPRLTARCAAKVTPGSTRAVREATSIRTDFIGVRSIMTPPSQTALPLTDPDICARWFSIHDRCKAVYGQRLP